MKKLKKLLALIVIVVLAVGTIFVIKKGFNYGIEYKEATEFRFLLAQVINMDEIEEIVREAFNGKNVKIQKIDYFNDSVNITVVDPTDEEVQTLIDKFNERYNQNNDMDSIKQVKTDDISIKEIIKPYLIPTVIALVIIAVYTGIRFRKLGILKLAMLPILISLLVEALYFAIHAIVRIPITLYTMPIALFILIFVLTISIYKYEKKV